MDTSDNNVSKPYYDNAVEYCDSIVQYCELVSFLNGSQHQMELITKSDCSDFYTDSEGRLKFNQ